MTDTTRTDDNAPLAPEQMLAIMERERMTIARRMAKQIPWILLAWGIAWLLGYGALWLIDGRSPRSRCRSCPPRSRSSCC